MSSADTGTGPAATFNLPRTGFPCLTNMQFFSGGWRPIVHGVAGFTIRNDSDGSVSIANNNTGTFSVRCCYYG